MHGREGAWMVGRGQAWWGEGHAWQGGCAW